MTDPMNQKFAMPSALCRQFDLDLPAYFEGEDCPGVVRHARECPFCGVVFADLELLRVEAPRLLDEDPPARVWANVRATLEAEGIFREAGKGWLKWFPQFGVMHYAAPLAALACLAIFGAFLIVSPPSSGPSTPAPSAGVYIPPPPPPVIAAMEKSYRAREQDMDPVLHASYQKGLQSLDNSIREISASVQKEPVNTLAREYLNTAYEQKVAVLSAALEYDGR